MSSCLSGGGRPYGLDLEIVKSPPSSSTWTSHSSSPSSTLSESSNSPVAISKRKPRTPRKRPNQTYNEAAALLSTAYPKIFSTEHLTKPCKFTKPYNSPFSYNSVDLLDNSISLLHHHPMLDKPTLLIGSKIANSLEKPCRSPREIDSRCVSVDVCDGFQDDFDAESILDEEIGEGIDSIMGNLSVNHEYFDESSSSWNVAAPNRTCYGYPIGLFGFGRGLDFDFVMRMRMKKKAFRNVDEVDWWSFPTVNVLSITPSFQENSVGVKKKTKKKKKKKKVENLEESKLPESSAVESLKISGNSADDATREEDSIPKLSSESLLNLNLNYDVVLTAWSDRGSPFSEEIPDSESSGNAIHARLAQIDLFSENGGGGVREASVLRYKEKRRTRLFSKKIRYQVRKVNADRRPRMKGRFVRRHNSPMSEQY